MATITIALPFSFIIFGQTQIDSGTASVFIAAMPIFTVIFSYFFDQEEGVSIRKLLGASLGLFGVFLICLPGIESSSDGQLYGRLLVAMCYAVGVLLGKKFGHKTKPVVNATCLMICSTIILLLLTLVFEDAFAIKPSYLQWSAVVGLGLFVTALGYVIFFQVSYKRWSYQFFHKTCFTIVQKLQAQVCHALLLSLF